MQELFLHCFEQFGEQTLLLIFCGPKGNGKTLRTERAMAAFCKGWITMSGPSSAKAGMQGNSDSSNGSNCVYDEMIDELTDGDGSNRTEYWKMILMKREYVYNKPVVVKGADGREMHKTFKLKTPHQETHCVCTNRGPAFTKGKEDPTEVKSALIDRAVVQFVRTLGTKTHDDQEFEKNLMNPEVKCKMRAFRILTCLMGLLKMLIFRQPYLKPDLALAQKLFDEWDNLLDRKYNLPKPSPRKNIKRLENLITMCCQNAVAHVFFFKQTAQMFEAGKTTSEFPKGKPFEMKMLYECVQLLQPTREMIHQAWCMGLEYSIGTSSMGLNTLTVVAEVTGRQIGDWFVKPPEKDYAEYIQEADQLIDLQAEHEAQQRKDGTGTGPRNNRALNPDKLSLPAFTRIFNGANDVMTETEVTQARSLLRARREARVEYQHRCSTSELQNQVMRDAQALADDCIGDSIASMSLEPLPQRPAAAQGTGTAAAPMEVDPQEGPREEGMEDQFDQFAATTGFTGLAEETVAPALPEFRDQRDEETMSEWEGEMPSELLGNRAWTVHRKEPGEFSPGDRAVFEAYHRARCIDLPGHANCCFGHAMTFEMMSACCYCMNDIVDDAAAVDAEAAAIATHLSLSASYVWPDLLEAGMFYLPQTCAQWAAGRAAYVDPSGCTLLGTVPCGAAFDYKKKNSGTGGAQRVDIGWLQAKGEQFKSWQTTALYIMGRGSRTVKEFDFHPDGLRDCLYMCSTADNSRRCPEEPRLPMDKRPDKNVQTNDGKQMGEHTVVVKVAEYKLPSSGRTLGREHLHLPRDPRSRIPDTNFQRRMDSMLHGGRLSALSILISNKVTNTPPIRMHQDGIEVNVAAIHAHTGLVAESVLACALVPGLRNMQEKFCNRQAGPAGLSAPRVPQKPAVGSKRSEDGSAKDGPKDAATLDPKLIHTLPYSYDVVGLALSMDMGRMLYDDVGEKAALKCTQTHGQSLGLSLEFENLPHISTRFIGFEEHNRQTISIKLEGARPEGQEYVEAGDPDASESAISIAHVRRSLGRNPTDSDMARYISRRQGARSMSGVRGDVFALSTWNNHTITTLKNRGLIRGDKAETIVRCFFDMEHCIQSRVVEMASFKKHLPKFEKMELDPAEPGTYSALEKEEATKKAVIETAAIEQQIHYLGYDADDMDYGLGDESPAASPQRRGRDCIDVGNGPEADD